MTQKPSERIEEIARELAYDACDCHLYKEENDEKHHDLEIYIPRATLQYLDEEAEKKGKTE